MPVRKAETSQGAPGWVVTYADFVTVLLCFFIALVSMSDIKKDRFQQAVESLQGAFGGFTGFKGGIETTPIEGNPKNTLIQRLSELETVMNKPGDSENEGRNATEEGGRDRGGSDLGGGQEFRVTTVRDGLRIVIGGRVAFDRFGAELKPEARELIAHTAERIRGYNTKVLVRGHATNEPLSPRSPFRDPRDLSYARANAVARALEENGVRTVRILAVAAGDTEPLVRQAYTEERRVLNRRVEILVTEDLVDDDAGSMSADELKGSSDGK
jgi:chemotaxis protein MotB